MKLRFFVLVYFSILVSTRSLESTDEEKLDKTEEPSIELDSTTTLAPTTRTDEKTENEPTSEPTIKEPESKETDPATSAPKIEEPTTTMTEKSETEVNPAQQITSVPVTEPIDTFPDTTTKATQKSETEPVIESTDEPTTVVTKKTETDAPLQTTSILDIVTTDSFNIITTTGKTESETTKISDSTVEPIIIVTEETKTDGDQQTINTLVPIPVTKATPDAITTPDLESTTDSTPKSEIDSTEEPARPAKLTFWQKLKYLLSPRKPYIFIIVGCIGFVFVSFLIFGFSRLLVHPEQSQEYNVAAHIERGRDNSRVQQFQLDFYKQSTDVVVVN